MKKWLRKKLLTYMCWKTRKKTQFFADPQKNPCNFFWDRFLKIYHTNLLIILQTCCTRRNESQIQKLKEEIDLEVAPQLDVFRWFWRPHNFFKKFKNSIFYSRFQRYFLPIFTIIDIQMWKIAFEGGGSPLKLIGSIADWYCSAQVIMIRRICAKINS